MGGRNVKLSTWNFCNIRTWNNNTLWQQTPYLITNFVSDFWVVSFVALEKIDATSFVMFKRTYTPYNEFCQRKNLTRHKRGHRQESRSQILFAMCITMHQQFTPLHVAFKKKHTHIDKLLVMFELPLLFSITTPPRVFAFKKKVSTMKLSMMPKLSTVFS